MTNMDKIIQNNDIILHISSFLSFEDKVVISKALNKNFMKTYNFIDINFENMSISDLFNLSNKDIDDEFCEYISELCSQFTNVMSDYYDDYYGYDIDDFMNDYYNNISYERIKDLSELFHNTYFSIYTRKVIEYIENNNLSIPYYDYDFFTLEKSLINIDFYDKIIEYYKYVFENEDINIFCDRCGLFGHFNASKQCIFYNVNNENKIIKQEVTNSITAIIDKIIDNQYKHENRVKREQLLCISCKINNKHTKCINYLCRTCCKGCKIHKKH